MNLETMDATGERLPDLAQKVLKAAQHAGLERYLLNEPLVVGVSGGADSLALLCILHNLRASEEHKALHVAYLDHGFRGEVALEEALMVAEIAGRWHISFTMQSFDVPAYARQRRLSDEEAARRARYAFLGAVAMSRGAAVAVAHTADDQVETVLLNLLRGTGTGGLGGMHVLSTMNLPYDDLLSTLGEDVHPGKFEVFRPLLEVWRSEVDKFCAQMGLKPRVDATNLDTAYKRNKIRHELIPLLQRQYSPAIKQHLLTLSDIARSDDRIAEEQIERQAELLARHDADGLRVRFEQAGVAALPHPLRRRLARWALLNVAGTLEGYTFDHIERTAGILCGEAGSPRAAHLPHGLVVEQSGGWATVGKRQDAIMKADLQQEAGLRPLVDPQVEVPIAFGETVSLLSDWQLRSSILGEEAALERGELVALFDLGELKSLGGLVVRGRRPGDTIRPLGLRGSKSLQDLFVDAKIPRKVRDFVPVVALVDPPGEVLWVPGPGGRRSVHAPLGPTTETILRLEFRRTSR